jgi:hypothetical protein
MAWQPLRTAVQYMSGLLHTLLESREHLCKQDEVLETRIQVSFSLELTDLVKVGAVNVGVHPEQALEYLLHDFLEIVGKGRANNTRECIAIIYLRA